jgi:flagellar hook-associated protein 3 FlgL
MSIDRVGTNASSQVLLAQIRKQQADLDQTSAQVSSGKVSDSYSGYDTKTALMEASRSKSAQADADAATAKGALNQLDLQDTQLSQLSDIANNVRDALSTAVSNGDASGLMDELSSYYQQAVQILNDKNGNSYTYGGQNSDTAPVTAASLSDLASLSDVSDAFANSTQARSVRIGDGQTVQTGVLASNVATDLFSMLQGIAQYDQGSNGSFGSSLTQDQKDFLQSQISVATSAAQTVTDQASANGTRYKQVQDAVDYLNASSTLYKNFTSSIEDADMGQASVQLTNNQTALKASYQVISTLNKTSLLDYL